MSGFAEDYIEVSERIREWYERFPDAAIVTHIVEYTPERVCVKATVFRLSEDAAPAGTGHSALAIPGSTPYTRGSELENAETSAVGRALVMAGLPSKRVASADEVQAHRPSPPRPAASGRSEGKPQPSEPPAPVLDLEDDEQWAGILGDTHGAPDADGTCPVHGTPWKHYAAGVSKKTGKPYEAGWSCETFGCREHPSDGWKARHAA